MNPLTPYFDIISETEDQIVFKPTDAWIHTRKIAGVKNPKKESFVFMKDGNTIKLSTTIDETKDITLTWKFKNGKWVILGGSRYFGDFFESHALVQICPECGQRIDCECHDSD